MGFHTLPNNQLVTLCQSCAVVANQVKEQVQEAADFQKEMIIRRSYDSNVYFGVGVIFGGIGGDLHWDLGAGFLVAGALCGLFGFTVRAFRV